MRWCSWGGARRPVSLRTLSSRVETHSTMTGGFNVSTDARTWLDKEGEWVNRL